ncbi:PREDICTED: mortality factor 4-like protein 1 [Priapulus caudatus]|uniref:Mortality factor 4-like protein 1 n=1 Tax=Priapulus caudatus TaxID=37621 RepID=A0ABM1EE88_PRICU|nr:PREDICTED: mortality factor 4-like protein 1 [Priapulus caudatus]
MAPKTKFEIGEKLLCYHGPILYEAKCVKTQIKDKVVKYLVHYSGWNKNWDEWVAENLVLKINDANLQKQKELEKEYSGIAAKMRKRTAGAKKKEDVKEKPESRSGTPSIEKPKVKEEKSTPSVSRSETPVLEPPAKKKRARLDPYTEPEDIFTTKTEIQIKIPQELRTWLVDDWDIVTRQNKLVNLPAKNTASQILDAYVRYKSIKDKTSNKEALTEVTRGIKDYFNVVLGKQLLYKFERPQYAEILAKYPDTPMSDIYGAEHLSRLFVNLGGYLAYTGLDEKAVELLLTHIHDFLGYTTRNVSSLYDLNAYVVASPEYQRKAL